MSTIQGVFDETLLHSIRAKADEIMFDDRIKQQFIPQIGIIDAVKAIQTAKVNPLFSNRKDSTGVPKRVDVEVMWENACQIVAQECTVCVLDGEKLSTNSQEYHLDFCKEVQFAVSEEDYIDNEFDYEPAIAKGILRADKQLSEAYAAYVVAVLESNKGVNQMGTQGKGVVVGSDTWIQAAYWSSALMPYFMRASILNRFTTPVLASGSNLFEDYMVINAMQANADGKGAANLGKTFPIYFDLFNIDTVNTPNLVTYLLSQNSLAMANRAYNPKTVETYGAAKRWQLPSKFIPGFNYDVFYGVECDNDFVKHEFKIKLLADLFVNPEGCEADNTGILTFVCGTGS